MMTDVMTAYESSQRHRRARHRQHVTGGHERAFLGSLFGGGSKSVKMDFIPYNARLPGIHRKQGERIVGDTLSRFENVSKSGETPESTALFNQSRQDTLNAFEDASRRSQFNLNRVGAGSSTSANEAFDRVMRQLGDTLSRQDMVRAAQLLDQQLSASQQGFSNVMGIAGSTAMVPQMPQQGILGDLLGMGGGGLLAGGLGGLGGLVGGSGFKSGFSGGISSFLGM